MAARFKKSREASLVRADGVVWSRNFLTTPPRPLHLKVASLLLLDVAATPPPAEEGRSLEPVPRLGLRSNRITFIRNRPTLDSVALHAPVKRAPAEAEHFRSSADIVFVAGKRFSDQ